MSKADHMLSILWLLRSGRRMTAKQLANELEIHLRTVYRYIDSLCASGVPIIADSGPNGGYRILNRFTESPLMFDMEEQKALAHASTFAHETGYPFKDELNRAINKLKRYTNEEQLDQIERHMEGITIINPPIEEMPRNWLRILEDAAAGGRSVEIVYDNGKRETPSIREIDPYSIVHWKGSWYAVGYCNLRKAIRSFRVDRISRITLRDRYFERPSEFSAKDFLLLNLLPGASDSESLLTVKIRGYEQALDLLCQHWLFSHTLVERKEGQALFKLSLSSLESYVPYFLLPYGKSLVILEPDMLIERLVEVSRDIAAHYESMLSVRIPDSKG
ncbi:YafY family transcriptional regulator [Virgibacillus sp. LDC1]|nr:YafY family transcriptional regulator [Virgibacillus sp. LDC1]